MTTAPATEERLLEDTQALLRMLAQGGTMGGLFGLDEHELDAMYAFGLGFYQQARYGDAAKVFGLLVTMKHGEPRFLNAYAATFQVLGRYEQAIHYYGVSQLLDPADPVPTFHTAECMVALGWLDDARDALSLVIRQSEEKSAQFGTLLSRARALAELVQSKLNQVKG
jgi:type III secretion system low calcium response chaperone LcrH/SycD